MAIEFKAAPGGKESDSGILDVFTLVQENGQLSVVSLVIAVVVIYGVVVYLRTTPGKRVTDIKVKRGAQKEAAAAVRRRQPPPPPEPEEAAKQS